MKFNHVTHVGRDEFGQEVFREWSFDQNLYSRTAPGG